MSAIQNAYQHSVDNKSDWPVITDALKDVKVMIQFDKSGGKNPEFRPFYIYTNRSISLKDNPIGFLQSLCTIAKVPPIGGGKVETPAVAGEVKPGGDAVAAVPQPAETAETIAVTDARIAKMYDDAITNSGSGLPEKVLNSKEWEAVQKAANALMDTIDKTGTKDDIYHKNLIRLSMSEMVLDNKGNAKRYIAAANKYFSKKEGNDYEKNKKAIASISKLLEKKA